MLRNNNILHLGGEKSRTFHGSRFSANGMRLEIEHMLDEYKHVTLDFSGVGVVTQSFIDEIIGVLILEHGPDILQRFSFKNCNEDVRSVIRYVANTRSEDANNQRLPAVH